MSIDRDGGPAFPAQPTMTMPSGVEMVHEKPGMSLRDWFAGQALMGMNASPELMEVLTASDLRGGDAFTRLSRASYEIADAMIAAREASK